MPYLTLIRHANPEIIPSQPSRTWQLSKTGIEHSRLLAGKLTRYTPTVIITSDEPKAIQTGEIIAETFQIECLQFPGLHEQERAGEPFTTQDDFLSKIRMLFEHQDELIFGSESGVQARERFSRAVGEVTKRFPGQNVAIVTHGTVLSLWIESVTDRSAYEFWQSLGLPSAVTLTYPEMEIIAETHV